MRKLTTLALGLVFLLPTPLVAGKNLAEYQLQIHILESHWHRHRDGSLDGWGRGDINDGASVHGFDFTYESGAPFHKTVGDDHYLAKWKKTGLKLEMLVGEIGAPDRYVSYELKTSVRDEVYVSTPDGVVPVSQEEYNNAKKQPQ
ncbi:MAG TPA: hypothetical protein VMX38_01995 [Verrucomicrobiae bacterium]|jgi:hypothetical protein|nr:hypothetical protein [Verrucomicrobiae bacterium]